MLSKQLKELEIDGIINREVHFGLSVIPILKSFSLELISFKNFEENRIR